LLLPQLELPALVVMLMRVAVVFFASFLAQAFAIINAPSS